jgi:tetratricopeptide (TPR) repeat protein
MRALVANVVMACVIGTLVPPASANDSSRPMAAAAFSLCERVDETPDGDRTERLARLEEGVRMGEAAVTADPSDARAYLAVGCNLGKQLNLSGLSWRSLGRLSRLREAIDRAYALAPADPDILIAKGEIARRLPSALGGDKAAGLVFFRRAVDVAPDNVAARVHLARAMADDRAPEARAQIKEALELAERCGVERDRSEARALLGPLE